MPLPKSSTADPANASRSSPRRSVMRRSSHTPLACCTSNLNSSRRGWRALTCSLGSGTTPRDRMDQISVARTAPVCVSPSVLLTAHRSASDSGSLFDSAAVDLVLHFHTTPIAIKIRRPLPAPRPSPSSFDEAEGCSPLHSVGARPDHERRPPTIEDVRVRGACVRWPDA